MERRSFLKNLGVLGIAGQADWTSLLSNPTDSIPVRRLTNGPKYHWFGYYDKWQVDAGNRYVLGMQVNFEGRTPDPDDVIKIGMIDLKDGDKWIELGESRSWGWQQGCMLQWLPGSPNEVIWNDRQGDKFVSIIRNVRTGKRRILPKPIYAISPDGTWAVGLDFARLQDLRPGYGYKGVTDTYKSVHAPDKTGIYTINLKSGKSKLIIPYSQCATLPFEGEDLGNYWHWYNHLLISPDGNRFTFLHRWRKEYKILPGSGFITRMFTADRNGNDLFVIDPSGWTSHFVWKDPSHICAWTQPLGEKAGFYLLEDKTARFSPVGHEKMPINGHNTYLPDQNNNIILNDCYPQGKERNQIPYLYNITENSRTDLGKFHSPKEYQGEWRCDLHPSFSPNGKMVLIDSVHEGLGRQIYLIDISKLV